MVMSIYAMYDCTLHETTTIYDTPTTNRWLFLLVYDYAHCKEWT